MSEEFNNNSFENRNNPDTQNGYTNDTQNQPAQPQSQPMQNPPKNPEGNQTFQAPPMYNTNYYSSEQPYNQISGMYSYPKNDYSYTNMQNTSSTPPTAKKEKKKKNSFGLILCCVAISAICGLGGALGGSFIYDNVINKPAATQGNGSGNTAVIYQSACVCTPDDATNDEGVVANVANACLPSVVEIRTEAVVNNSFYGQYVTTGAGSGVIITQDGYIVTNNHVISGASSITVRLTSGDEYEAKLIGADAQTDIAVIKIDASGLKPAVYGDSKELVVGELAIAIGNPLGKLGGTVTNGIISALDREITVEGEQMVLLQTNAAVSPGNSGGGLFNSNGELIGIVNAKSSGDNVEGLGFAIPINTAEPIIKDIIENGHVTGRPSLGITIVDITTEYQKYTYKVNEYGVYIQKSVNGDFKAGDRIIAVDGNSVSVSSDIKAIINSHKVGDTVTVTVSRKNKILDVEVTLMDSAQNNG